jgi:hypothetical protein
MFPSSSLTGAKIASYSTASKQETHCGQLHEMHQGMLATFHFNPIKKPDMGSFGSVSC